MSVEASTVNLTAKPYCVKREEFSVAEVSELLNAVDENEVYVYLYDKIEYQSAAYFCIIGLLVIFLCIVAPPVATRSWRVCSGSIVVTTLDCGPGGSRFESRVGANIL